MNELEDFRVGDRLVRPALSQVVAGDREVHVEPRSMDVLVALAHHGNGVYPKKDLIKAVWKDAFVSDEVLTHAVWELRKALGDDANHPRFIQTIPKRGYRLIAEVDRTEARPGVAEEAPAPVTAPEAGPVRPLWWVLGGTLLMIVLLLVLRSTSQPEPATPKPSQPPADGRYRLEIVSEGAAGLDREVASLLIGSSKLEVGEQEACSQSASERTYCLTVKVRTEDGGRTAQALLIDAHLGRPVYSPPRMRYGSGVDPAEELKTVVLAFFDVVRLPYFGHEDLEPWYDMSLHDIRAIRDFHFAAGYIYNHEVGARDYLASALAHDPDFLGARIWHLPTVVEEGDTDLRDEYLLHFDRLFNNGTAFEKAMINFARAHAYGKVAEQLQHLEAALVLYPENRPLVLNRALILRALDEHSEALEDFGALVRGRWEFSGLYATAAECALLNNDPEAARQTLDVALDLEASEGEVPISPEALALLELLAIYEGDAKATDLYRQRLEKRIVTLPNEVYSYDRSPYAEILAKLAESEGRDEIAKKLRELPD